MGKKARKTRWRALTLADEYSDSEASSTTTAPGLREVFKSQKYSSNRYTYSSQSTPRRKFQYDGTKSTRSSSTTSENKMAFNEDDYTKISTPRQDVLFKKGYLNKPKNYNTQTSTGASTNSTGNSTGNGTPDYQSTDLEYESQFVFPNGFVDHNGFYYVNGYEYPFMFYNVPTYYPEYSNHRSKRYSSGSLTESTSPNNEEVTSQDLSGAEASNTHSDYSGHYLHRPDCPNYYQNSTSSPNSVTNGEGSIDQIRKIKKRRRRRTTSQSGEVDSSETSDDEANNEGQRTITSNQIESNEMLVKPNVELKETNGVCSEIEERLLQDLKEETNEKDQSTNISLCVENETPMSLDDSESSQNPEKDLKPTTHPETSGNRNTSNQIETRDNLKYLEQSRDFNNSETAKSDTLNQSSITDHSEAITNPEISKYPEPSHQEENLGSQPSKNSEIPKDFETIDQSTSDQSTTVKQFNIETSDMETCPQDQKSIIQKYDLKPDAEEFVPRAYRTHDIPMSPVQFINISGNFVPIPLFPFNGQNFNPAFIPPGIPINFIPPDPKMFPNFMGYPHNNPSCNEHGDVSNEEHHYSQKVQATNNNCDNSNTASDQKPEPEPIDKNKLCNKTIDIATVVSKLEVAAKEQEEKESSTANKTIPGENNDNGSKRYPRNHPRYKNNISFNANYNNRSQNSPQREMRYRNRDLRPRNISSVPKDEKNNLNISKNNNPIENAEINNTSNPSFKMNYPPVSQANSSSIQNSDSSLNSPKTYSHRKLPQNVPNSPSPLRKNNESLKKSPYRPNMVKSSTTAFMPSIANGFTEVESPPATSSSELNSPNVSGKTPEKLKKVWKQTNHPNNKWKQLHTAYDNKTKFVENKIVGNGIKTDIRNYSENSKLSPNGKDFLQISADINKEIKSIKKTETTKVANLPQDTSNNILRSPNQWISVQKRKKRKNKNVEEVGNFTDEEIDDIQNDQFESFDVNQLVDVVIPSENEGLNSSSYDKLDENIPQDQNVEEVLTVVIETESPTMETDTTPNESKETPEIMNTPEIQEVVEVLSSVNQIQTESENLEHVVVSVDTKDASQITLTKDKKKKFKKNSQKPLKKKVIIKDLDLSDQYIEIKEPVKKIVTKIEKAVPLPSKSQEKVVKEHCDEPKVESTKEGAEVFEKEPSTESNNSSDRDENKKSKKKKKKSTKINNNNISFSSDSILGSMEDTFDFLNSALYGETEDKTNDEISEELDKIIQKGMLNSIEEKIKTLNIDESDGFFKSVWTKLSRKETSMGYSKIPDFTEILKPSSKSQLVSEEIDLQNKKCSEILHPDSVEPTIEDGLFLENPDLVEVLEDDEKAVIPPETITPDKEEVKFTKYEIEIGEIEHPNTLYPITRAVKEWMCRTRETTPDVELLKSPSKIYQEFRDISDSDSEIETRDSVRNSSKELTPYSEITFSATEREQSLDQQDLMEYWEDDVKLDENNFVNNEHNLNEDKTSDEDEDEIPIYESQYGKNEDFLNIQRKVREQNGALGGSSQTHTSLPQRAAVCCNIM